MAVLNSKYIVKKEIICGVEYFMVYRKRWIFPDIFIERQNTEWLAHLRLQELNGQSGNKPNT